MKAKVLLALIASILTLPIFAKKSDKKSLPDTIPTIEEITIEDIESDPILIDTMLEERPEEVYDSIVYKARMSTMHIPVEINMSALEKMINDNFEGLLYEDNNIDDDSLMVKAWKVENFRIQYDNDELTYQIPIKLWIKKRFGLGFTHTDREIEASIKMDLKTKLGFSKNWAIVSSTEVLRYSWIQKPTMKVAGMDVPITYFVEKIIKNYQKEIGKTVDKAVNDIIPLKTYVTEIWESVQDPIDVSMEGYQAWIKTTPKQLYTTPIVGKYGILKTTIGIKCLMEVFIGKTPKKIVKETQLPPFKQYRETDENVLICLFADIPYEILDSVAKSILVGEKFGEGRHEIQVSDIEVYGQSDELIIGLSVSGFINGKIFLNGTPYYEKETSNIRIKEVDYKIKTKNMLAKVVNLFYKRGLKKKLEEELKFSLQDEFTLIKEMSRSELFNMELMPNVRMNGFIQKLDVEQLFLTPTGLKVDLDIAGKISIKME